MARPNLFDFATSELSQDAFFCWLAAWAAPAHAAADPALHEAGVDLLRTLLAAGGHVPPARFHRVEVRRQLEKIDVLILVDEAWAILIEDKVDSGDHSNQLARYRARLGEHALAHGRAIVPIYLKTRDQSNLSVPVSAGYACFMRPQILRVLRRGLERGVCNPIFVDFAERLERIEAEVAAWPHTPVAAWQDPQWVGFFARVQRELGDGEWGFVPHPGLFWAFWWHGRAHRYLQLSADVLCFRVEVRDKSNDTRRDTRDLWRAALMRAASETGLLELKKNRRSVGETMTAMQLRGDYRATNAAGHIDLPATLRTLRAAEQLMTAAEAKISR